MFLDRAARRHLAVALLAVVAGACAAGGLTACSGRSRPAVATTSVPTPVPTSTTTVSTLPPTTVYQPSAPQPTAEQASSHLVAAWKGGDRAAALTDAAPAAVDGIFSQPFPAGGVQARGCANAVAGPSSCVYRIFANGSLLDLSAVGVSGGWFISAARFES